MPRVLPVLALLLVALLVLGRLGRTGPPTPPAEGPPAATETQRSAGEARSLAPPPPAAAPADSGSLTPTIDRLVTLANRQRIAREARYTYIDSLLAESDSLIRRWPERDGAPLRVALLESPELPGWTGNLPGIVRRALFAWQEVFPELRFDVVNEPDAADLVVRWLERFELERTGQTDLQYLPDGEIRHADIQLALQTHAGQPLRPEGMLAVAIHEVGHALGLPHSGNPRDVMYPDTRTATISPRDRATLVLLYSVTAGSLRVAP